MEFLTFILALFRGEKSIEDVDVKKMFQPALITLASASGVIGLLYSYLGAVSIWSGKLDWKDFFVGLIKYVPMVALSFVIIVGLLFMFITVLKLDTDWQLYVVHTAIMFISIVPFLVLSVVFASNLTFSIVFGQVSMVVPFLYIFWFLSNNKTLPIIKVFWGTISIALLSSVAFNFLGVNPFSISTISTIEALLSNLF